MAPNIKIFVFGAQPRIEFVLDDEHDSLEKIQAILDVGQNVDCRITHQSVTHNYHLKKGYPLDLIYLKSLRVIHGILADPSTGSHCGWIQIGRCEVDSETSTQEKVFAEFRFKNSGSKLFTCMPPGDEFLQPFQNAEESGVCQAMHFQFIQHDDLVTISWIESWTSWLARLRFSWFQKASETAFLKPMYQVLLFILQKLTCPSTANCDHVVAEYPFCKGKYVPDWTCVRCVPPTYQGNEVKIVVRFTSELTDRYGDSFCKALAESAVSDFSNTLSNSGISTAIQFKSQIIENSTAGITLIDQNGDTNLNMVDRIVKEQIDEQDPNGQFHLTMLNYDEGQARGNVISVGFWSIGLGIVQHEIAHSFGISHYENEFGNQGSNLGRWATVISRQGVEPQRINMLSTKQVKYSAILGTSSCTQDAASSIDSNIGFIQYFPQENLP